MLIQTPASTSVPESIASGPDMTRYMLVCVGLAALLIAVAWIFRRFVADSVRRRAAKRSLRVVDVLPLGGKRKLAVVQCYDRSFLIGLGEKELTSIAELDVEEAKGAPPLEEEDTEPEGEQERLPQPPFAETLRAALRSPEGLHPARPVEPRRWKPGEGVLG